MINTIALYPKSAEDLKGVGGGGGGRRGGGGGVGGGGGRRGGGSFQVSGFLYLRISVPLKSHP